MQKIIKYSSLLVVMVLYFTYQSKGQDAILLLNKQTPLYQNPALVGYEDYTRISINYRNHFPAVGNGFVTYSASFDTYLKNINSGVGVSIMRDQPGSKAYNYNNAMLAYSYHIPVGENKTIRAGLLANFYYSVEDPSKLIFPDMPNVDGSINENPDPYGRARSVGVDMGAGALYKSRMVTIGAAFYHLGNKNDSSYHRRSVKFNTHAEIRIPLYNKQTYANPVGGIQSMLKEANLSPAIYYWQQGYTKMTGIGINLHTKNLRAGLASRQDIKFNSMIFSARLGFAAAFVEIDYIFDIGKLGDNFKGLSATSHEIGIIFKFGEEKEY